MNGTWTSGLLAAIAVAGDGQERTVGDVYHAGDEATWVIEQEGKTLGHCWSRYEGEVELPGLRAHLFRAQAEVKTETPAGALEQRFTTELWTDERGHPLRFVFQARVSDVHGSVEAVLADGKVDLTVRQGPGERVLVVDVPASAYLLANNFASHVELLAALDAPGTGESRQYTLFSAGSLVTLPYTLKQVEERPDDEGGPDDEPVSVYEDSLGERLHLTQAGRLVLVEVPVQKIVMRRVEQAPLRFTLVAPASADKAPDFEREEIRIEDGDVTLAGTITKPRGATGRLPAVTFVSGSGPQDRDGFSSGIDLGTHEILDRLTRDGFLVLRVDDRGVGESKGPTKDMTFLDLVEDARRAVVFLLERADVDPRRVAVIGHSEGGETAPLLAASLPEIAAIVLMAGPGRPVDALLGEQLRRAHREEGESAEELAKFAVDFADFMQQIRSDGPLDAKTLPPDLAIFVPARTWLKSHTLQDPIANLKQVRCPVLILQGERDIQVSAERDAPTLLAALDQAGHKDHELVVFPKLDHLFKQTLGETSSGLDYLKSRPIAPEFLDKLSAWLAAHLIAKK